jgi:hypothetical protein
VTTVVPSVPEKDRWLDGLTTSSGFAPFQSITVTPGHGIWVGNTAIRAVTDAGQIVTIVGRKNQEVRDGDEHYAKFSTVRAIVPLAYRMMDALYHRREVAQNAVRQATLQLFKEKLTSSFLM